MGEWEGGLGCASTFFSSDLLTGLRSYKTYVIYEIYIYIYICIYVYICV